MKKDETFEVKVRYSDYFTRTLIESEIERILNENNLTCIFVGLFDLEALERRKRRLKSEMSYLNDEIKRLKEARKELKDGISK